MPPTLIDITIAYGAICLFVILAALAVLTVYAVNDWIGDKLKQRRGLREDREVAELEAIPFMLDWPTAPENRFERQVWKP